MAVGDLIAKGSFTSDGSDKNIVLRSDFDVFIAYNRTQAATTQSTGRGCVFKWFKGQSNGEAFMYTKQNSANALDLEVITSGGFKRFDTSNTAPEAEKSGSAVTADNPAEVTITGHGYQTGDRVRIYDTTDMYQIAGYEFYVTRTGANTFDLEYLDASGFSAAASAVKARRIPNNPLFKPERNWITNISQASQAVVTLSLTHRLSVGEKVRFAVPSNFGMVEMDGLAGEIKAVSTANNTITVDIDSSAFTAFSFPTSAQAALGQSPAIIVPFGAVNTDRDDPTDNQAEIVMTLSGGADGPAGSNNDVIYWQAFKASYVLDE